MKEKGAVAVVIPAYNRRLKLIKTLESVVAQSKLPAILILVDDGSTDGTAEAAKNWLEQNAPFEWQVVVQANAGAAAARNAGFAHIGDLPYVCFLDSDDLWPRDFIADGLSALEAREDIVAAVADKVRERAGRREQARHSGSVSSNPLLWLIVNGGAILSCTMIRSSAARAAGLFVPGMVVSEDTDFFLRLFLQGGVAHSKAAPVLFIRKAPLEPTEAPNLTDPSPDLKYQWADHLAKSVSGLPKDTLKEHEHLIRTAVARRWASVAFSSLKAQRMGLALHCLFHAIWWDHDLGRRCRLIWSFLRGRKAVLAYFSNPFWERSELTNDKDEPGCRSGSGIRPAP